MPDSKFQWQTRVKGVEREHKATRFGTDFLLRTVQRDPGALGGDLRLRDLNEAAKRQEGTYIIRLFAEFETCLRAFWEVTRRGRSPARTRDLLDGVGARRKISDDQIDHAHSVREYRNSLVHERKERIERITIDEARRRLCRFLSFLPLHGKSMRDRWRLSFDAAPSGRG